MLKQFTKISAVDILNLTDEGKQDIQKFSQTPIIYPDTHPEDLDETAQRIGDADAILISYETELSPELIANAPNLGYIGICGTSLAHIPQRVVEQKGITVTNVSDYSEEGTAEYIFLQLLKLARGDGPYQWQISQTELNGKTIGIVGFGPVGRQVAKLALGLEMKVLYNCPAPKPEFESKNIRYAKLNELLGTSDIISLHVPKNTIVLGPDLFDQIKPGAILVDTCLGKVFETEDFIAWIKKGQNYAILDQAVRQEQHEAFADLPNVILCPDVAGITQESKQRLTAKAVANIEDHLASH